MSALTLFLLAGLNFILSFVAEHWWEKEHLATRLIILAVMFLIWGRIELWGEDRRREDRRRR